MMKRVYNFAAGPAALPEPVLKKLQEDIFNYKGSGMGVMEISHRSKEFDQIAEESESRLRKILDISDEYYTLFLNDGASKQFSVAPLNLKRGKASADYIQTGHWSQRAMDEAKNILNVRIAASTKDVNYTRVPTQQEISVDPGAAYLYYTANETIGGLEYPYTPDSAGLPIVSDMSSNFLSKPIDIKKHGLIFASAQKNFGPSSFCIAIIRKDLTGHAPAGTPKLDDYAVQAKEGSRFNTPNTLAWYTADLVFEWIREQGGLEAINERNRAKSQMLYDYIDKSTLYANPIQKSSRSRMNVPFTLKTQNKELDKTFVEEAKNAGLTNLEGHRSIGGMRASIYNAMPIEGVKALVEFMKQFEEKHHT